MLDIKFIIDNPEVVKKAAQDKGIDLDVDQLLALDRERRMLKGKIDSLREQRNTLSREIPKLAGQGKQQAIDWVRDIKEALASMEGELADVQQELDRLLLLVPGIPAPEVPVGRGEEDNVEVGRWGEIPKFDFVPKDHLELAEALDMVDIPRGVKVAGSRSYILKGYGALLELALCRFAIDRLLAKGYTLMHVPVLARERALMGTGYFPLGRDQAYAIPEDELFLAGTSEVGLVACHQDEVLDVAELPVKYAGHTPCFRREAGTYGRDTRGLYRVHQFQKVEQVVICRADDEEAAKLHMELLGNAEEIMQALGLPYRVALACTGEIGQGQVRKHEIEAWMPSRNGYCETHSCSTFNDFQARRLNIKYRDEDGKTKFAYTLNNTAIASPRILIPLLENYQQEDGSVVLPAVLRPYMGGLEKLEPR